MTFKEKFLKAVDEGLSAYPKHISSRYFYDAKGDRLFQKIMKMQEYYLTDAERWILENRSEELLNQLPQGQPLNVYEMGAGDGTKTVILLKAMEAANRLEAYHPIDISADVLQQLEDHMRQQGIESPIHPQNLTYDEALEQIKTPADSVNVMLFFGSNLGNLLHDKAIVFLKTIREWMGEKDVLVLGLDKMKDPEKILPAYNDSQGITRDFNLNLLDRINRELGGNFNREHFKHWPVYDPETGTTKSYLLSTRDQTVTLDANGKSYHFHDWESLHTEISQKYNQPVVEWLCEQSGLNLQAIIYDDQRQFMQCIVRRD
jgi:dimethylhistidine N-methyltransferase